MKRKHLCSQLLTKANRQGEIHMWMLLGIYLLLINGYTFLIMKHDKQQARRGGRRIPEQHLYMMSWIGGAIGVLSAMRRYRHKTKHTGFRFGIPLIILFHMLLLMMFILIFYPVNLDFLM